MTDNNGHDLDAFRARCAAFLDEHATGITVADVQEPRHELTYDTHPEGFAWKARRRQHRDSLSLLAKMTGAGASRRLSQAGVI